MDLHTWLFIAIPLGIGIGYWASTRGRSGFGWFLLCLLFSPFLVAILLAILPKRSRESTSEVAATPRPVAGTAMPETWSHQTPPAAPTVAAAPSDDDFAAAFNECTSPERLPGPWAKAFADALGDENKARALYTARRAAEMAEKRDELERNELRETAEGRARLEREAYAALPKGTCPSCKTVQPLNSEDCVNTRCGANFTSPAPGAWRVQPLEG